MFEAAIISWVINRVAMGTNSRKAPIPAATVKPRATYDEVFEMYFQF